MSTKIKVKCHFCGKTYLRELGRANEAKKLGWNQYCSPRCQYAAKTKRLMAKKDKLNMIELKPADLFPKNKLDIVLNFLKK